MGGQWKRPEVSRLFPQEKAPRLGEQGTSAVCGTERPVTRSAQKQQLENRRSAPGYTNVYKSYELQMRLTQWLSARITEGLVFSPLHLPGRWLLLSRAPQGSQDLRPQLREKKGQGASSRPAGKGRCCHQEHGGMEARWPRPALVPCGDHPPGRGPIPRGEAG